MAIPLFCYLAEKIFFFVIKKIIKKKKKTEQKFQEKLDFYQEIKYYIEKELEFQVSSSKVEILINSIARALHDKYSSGINEKRRKADICRLFKLLDDACRLGKVPLEEIINIEEMPLPIYKSKTTRLILPKYSLIKSKFKKKQGYWPSELVYPW